MLDDPFGLNPLTEKIIGCGMAVHRAFGQGLLESLYKDCLVIEMRATGLKVEVERKLPLVYRGVAVGKGTKSI
jgi:GxxExxY protein